MASREGQDLAYQTAYQAKTYVVVQGRCRHERRANQSNLIASGEQMHLTPMLADHQAWQKGPPVWSGPKSREEPPGEGDDIT